MKHLVYILTIILFCACSTTKNIPENEHLLDKVDIKADNKKIDVSELENFVRQKPNSSLPLFGKVRLKIYNMAGQDTSKWLTRFVQNKLGQAPVLFSARQADLTTNQLEKEMYNQGYLNAEVDTALKVKGKKLSVTYNIESGTPYRVRNYKYTLRDSTVSRILNYTRGFSEIKPDILFNQEILEEERVFKSNVLRNLGYYRFSKENLFFRADTTLNSNQVDLYLTLRNSPDSLAFNRYRIRNVTIVSGYDVTNDDNEENFQNPDTTYRQGISIIHGKNNFLKNSMLLRNNYIRPGKLYSEMAVSRTYSAFNGTGAVKQTSIELTPVQKDSLNFVDARITLSPGNVHWFQAGLDGTNSAGDFGIAPSLSYQHRNFFNGAEIFTIKLKGAYEFITGDKSMELGNKNYYEYGIETGLTFPKFLFPLLKKSWKETPSAQTQISLGLTNQHRSEYTRQFFNATYTFRWQSNRKKFTHALDLLDVNYIRMPWTSHDFDSTLIKNPVLKATYENQLIARTGYNLTYTWGKGRRFPRNTYTLRVGADVSGLLPRLVHTLSNSEKNKNGRYEIMGTAYAEYLKGDISFAQTRLFNKQQSVAYRIALGVANPFGNSNILPYERRYFSGGANSVRGWSTRRLGPGGYQTNDSTSFINQAGDVKLDMSIEYRHKVSELFELAGFVDAGNIWTIKDYEGQEGGKFKFSEFYKEIAVAYGLGFRVDLQFLLLRLDLGFRAYDPGRKEGDRFMMFKPKLSRDMAWHFAIGYPF
ncbi:MAG: BamA/TamA family outer membrane protein [Dysgonomonas sp.]